MRGKRFNRYSVSESEYCNDAVIYAGTYYFSTQGITLLSSLVLPLEEDLSWP